MMAHMPSFPEPKCLVLAWCVGELGGSGEYDLIEQFSLRQGRNTDTENRGCDSGHDAFGLHEVFGGRADGDLLKSR